MAMGPALAEVLRLPKIENVATVKECGACHMVYAPQMLPQRSWTALMTSLENHFGENAKVEEPARADIEAYLLANAADALGAKGYGRLMRNVKPDAVPVRVTELNWWVRAHHEVNVVRIKATPVKSPGNCIGCHVGSDKTMIYNEPY